MRLKRRICLSNKQQRLKIMQLYCCKTLRNFYYQNYSSLIPVIELKKMQFVVLT